MWKEDEERRGSLMLLIKHMLAFFFLSVFSHNHHNQFLRPAHICWELPSLLDLTAVVGSAFAFAAVFLAPGFGRTAVILPVCPGKALCR